MKKKPFITKYQAILLVIAVLANIIVYSGTRLFTQSRYHFDFSTVIDEFIPLISWTVLIYVGWFPFFIFNYYLAVRYETKDANRFVLAHLLGTGVCCLCFLIIPTSMQRPALAPDISLRWLLDMVYTADTPDNLFPSMHCYVSTLCWLGLRNNKKIPKWYRVFILIFAVAVCISTVTVKQHLFADVVAGVVLASLSYYVSGKIMAIKLAKRAAV